ncbi:hypothetical protein NLX67_01170 [Domibacillus sp. A3M-37]|uniref:hypothetical protein n=1 Tax=Domibacillus sp. A3M-37 TaxID=2962037 RepID=UPI000B169F42|nr:hypothetical protein [Domibacillus sp. A3M-37]MCP3761005.1 hypothetical protein [Domibacillus sp. A3M-37]
MHERAGSCEHAPLAAVPKRDRYDAQSFFTNKHQPKNGVKQKGRRLLREQQGT